MQAVLLYQYCLTLANSPCQYIILAMFIFHLRVL
nr:MAG TPA: nigellin-1.1, antimicrobial peptide, ANTIMICROBIAL PROTEIN [Caudoviricetes sp.]